MTNPSDNVTARRAPSTPWNTSLSSSSGNETALPHALSGALSEAESHGHGETIHDVLLDTARRHQHDDRSFAFEGIAQARVNAPYVAQYPFCALPSHYFDRLLWIDSEERESLLPRTLLSVETWDGRAVLEIETSS